MNSVLWIPYCGPGATPADILARWNLDPILLAVLAAATLLIVLRRSGRARVLGLTGMAVLAIAFISPLCALSSALFAARTVHHVLLVAVAAPLLAYSLPRRAVGPLALATAVQALVLWAWHGPAVYEAALSRDLVYWVMQTTILGSAVWFWMGVRQASAPAAVVALLAAMVAMGLLGALLTFISASLYAPHLLTTSVWGLTPIEDQQTAGLIMWAPAAALYLGAALVVLGRWIGPDRGEPHAA
ncbi:MAG: cytochrome c oxidase assembly protein [Brevundimonas sp.]|nr:MAG: cytochrome c oxidase assembly protein [Brevundimonas sp.]